MKRVLTTFLFLFSTLCQSILLGFSCFAAPAQTSLEFFTNQANTLLQAQFGFGVTNIPVYSSTNLTLTYNPSVHYLLQSTANSYDATTPPTNLPSVFRPLLFATNYGASNQAAFIIGYASVTNDFYTQISRGFKVLTDPTISSDDNVWGVPWIVGTKNNIPTFNEYCYSSEVSVARKLVFTRYPNPTNASLGDPSRPPQFTNQFFTMFVSNLFGVDAWNSYATSFTNSVTLVASNQISIIITNDYNWGTNLSVAEATNWLIDSWPSWPELNSPLGFLIPLLTNTAPLQPSYWSDASDQFITAPGDVPFPYLPEDLHQTGWPIHTWTLNITNKLLCALIDNATGQVLDFVNLGPFGSSLNITQQLITNTLGPNTTNLMWFAGVATDQNSSPMSSGVLDQIATGMAQNSLFSSLISGINLEDTELYFSDPYIPVATFLQNCSWHASNPLVHYTIADLIDPSFNQEVVDQTNAMTSSPALNLDNTICSLGHVTPDYTSGTIASVGCNLEDGSFLIEFSGVVDLPYTIWGSTNIYAWSQIGVAAQPTPGIFQFEDRAATNYTARFYEVRLP
jgi:hypothetical protein